MYGKPAMTCFKYQVYLYGSEAITLFERYTLSGYRASTMSHQTAPTPHYRQPSRLCVAAQPSPIWKRTFVWLNYHTYVKKQRENLYG
jgi:hypothetical protein